MIMSAHVKVYHLEGKWVPTQPTLYQQCLLTSCIYMIKDCETGLTGFFYSKKTRKSNTLQMTLKRQHFSSSILKILINNWSGWGLKLLFTKYG